MNRIICVGELVVDWFRAKDESTMHAAGTPANVAVALARLGRASVMVGRVGKDAAGAWLKSRLSEEGVDVTGVRVDLGALTRVCRVALSESGERVGLSVTSERPADERVTASDLDAGMFANAGGLYFSSTLLSSSPRNLAAKRALKLARKNGLLVAVDLNLWPAMWASDEAMRAGVLAVLKDVDVLKVNRYEFAFLAGSDAVDPASVEAFRARFGISHLFVTLGADGCVFASLSGAGVLPAFKVEVADTGGAGDAFMASAFDALMKAADGKGENLRSALAELDVDVVSDAVRRGCAAGAIVVSRVGALSSMPTASEVEMFLSERETGARATLVS